MTRLSDAEFVAVRAYLSEQAGLAFDESRRSTLSAVLADRLAETGTRDVLAYLAGLRGERGARERQQLLDAVTVQETRFFRNPPQVEALRRRVLPELLRRPRPAGRPLTLWSAGCSTGEEPYTLAMLLLELAPALAAPGAVRIVGTDVSAAALRAATRAIYSGRTLDSMPPLVADRWLEKRPGTTYGVRDEVRRLVEFRLHNLVTDPAPFAPGEVDLVVCRNVTIYFDRTTTARLIGSFHGVLAEGGYLLLGHSETLWQVSSAFTVVPMDEAFVYRRAQGSRRPSLAKRLQRRSAAPPRPPVPARREAVAAAAPVPARSSDALLAAARVAFADGLYEAAAQAAQAAVLADPLLAPAHLLLGESLGTIGQDGAAVVALRKAVYLDPLLAPAHFLLAGALSRLGQPLPAAVSYRAAAGALDTAPPGRHEAFLGGRAPAELAALCRRLAEESARGGAASAVAATAAPWAGRVPPAAAGGGRS